MTTDTVTIHGIEFTLAAARCIEQCDVNGITDDLEMLRSGEHTRESLLEYCCDGADDEQGWIEYVDALVAAI